MDFEFEFSNNPRLGLDYGIMFSCLYFYFIVLYGHSPHSSVVYVFCSQSSWIYFTMYAGQSSLEIIFYVGVVGNMWQT